MNDNTENASFPEMIKTDRAARIFKALSDESRLKIMSLLGSSETCACVLLESLSMSQPTLSHHMKLLVEAGLVNCRKEGRWAKYTLNTAGIAAASLYLDVIKQGEGCSCGVC